MHGEARMLYKQGAPQMVIGCSQTGLLDMSQAETVEAAAGFIASLGAEPVTLQELVLISQD
eukprot:4306489-Prorocentrum_lima.AAC.1